MESARLTQEQLSEMLGGRLYITDGNGRYTKSTKMLLALCASLNNSSDSICFPGNDRHCLDITSRYDESMSLK